jgi:hypothetical protein
MLVVDIHNRSFLFDTKALGTLVVYRLTTDKWFKLADYVKNPDDFSEEQIVDILIWFAAHCKTGDTPPPHDDEQSRLTLEQIQSLGNIERAELAERYIEMHNSSVRTTKTVVEETEAGEKTTREVVENLVDLPKNDGETPIAYLGRLVRDQLKSIQEQTRKMKDLFDQNIRKQFRETSTAWSALADSVSQFQKQWQGAIPFKTEMRPFLDVPTIDLKPFKSPFPDIKNRLEEISNYQAKFTPLIVDSANLLGQMYQLSSDVAVDFK